MSNFKALVLLFRLISAPWGRFGYLVDEVQNCAGPHPDIDCGKCGRTTFPEGPDDGADEGIDFFFPFRRPLTSNKWAS